jgi:hypothetical protein
MTNVQIAISDPDYAEALRDLLMADGQHQVHIVNYPNPAINGVVVVDDTVVSRMTSSPGLDFNRCVIFTNKVAVEANQLWEGWRASRDPCRPTSTRGPVGGSSGGEATGQCHGFRSKAFDV